MTVNQTGSPSVRPKKTQRVYAHYNDGTLLKVRLKKAHHLALEEAQNLLDTASGLLFSSTILVRRSLERYLQELQKLGKEDILAEARHLLHHFR